MPYPIHRLPAPIEEMLYSALEDFRVDILIGSGPGARTHSLPIPPFTAIGEQIPAVTPGGRAAATGGSARSPAP